MLISLVAILAMLRATQSHMAILRYFIIFYFWHFALEILYNILSRKIEKSWNFRQFSFYSWKSWTHWFSWNFIDTPGEIFGILVLNLNFIFLRKFFLWSFFLDNAECWQLINNKYGIQPWTFTYILVWLVSFYKKMKDSRGQYIASFQNGVRNISNSIFPVNWIYILRTDRYTPFSSNLFLVFS